MSEPFTPTRYEVHDVLTLYALMATHPDAFVAAGEKSRRFYCIKTLDKDSDKLMEFEAELSVYRKRHTIILYPTWRDADGMLHDVVSDNCYACGRPLRAHQRKLTHERPDNRPDGMVPADVQKRRGQGPAGKRRR